MITELRLKATRAVEDFWLEPATCRAQVADCVCPDACERDHSSE